MNFPSCPNEMLLPHYLLAQCLGSHSDATFAHLKATFPVWSRPVLAGLNRFLSFTLKRERFLKAVGHFKNLSTFTRFSFFFCHLLLLFVLGSTGNNKLRLRPLRHCCVSNVRDKILLSTQLFEHSNLYK